MVARMMSFSAALRAGVSSEHQVRWAVALALGCVAEDGFGELEVGFRGDLQIEGIAFNESDGVAEAFDEGGIVGAGEVRLFVGAAEEVGVEDLRSLCGEEVGAIDGFDDGAGLEFVSAGIAEDGGSDGVIFDGGFGFFASAFERVGDRDGGDDGVEELGGVDDSFEEVTGETRAGGIVDGDVGGVVGNVVEGVLHRLPAIDAAAGNDGSAAQADGIAEAGADFIDAIGIDGDENGVDFGAIGKRLDTSE